MIYDGIFYEILDQLGTMPLPPFIKEKLNDKIVIKQFMLKLSLGCHTTSSGLHFTDEIIEKIKARGVQIVDVTLHVGLGTFRPVKVENVLEHHMHSEFYMISKESADILNQAKANHQRIISVGTTSTRVLESNYTKYHCFKETSENTDIFIYPGYEYKAIDALITNFHLPKSTLLMLISALASKELIFKAYHEAIEREYRFFSFGDSMFITNE